MITIKLINGYWMFIVSTLKGIMETSWTENASFVVTNTFSLSNDVDVDVVVLLLMLLFTYIHTYIHVTQCLLWKTVRNHRAKRQRTEDTDLRPSGKVLEKIFDCV